MTGSGTGVDDKPFELVGQIRHVSLPSLFIESRK
jgi:hypothetical protein